MAEKFDVAVVGGGIAGASLAYAMAKGGVRAVVLEAETEFKDRVRGEVLCPWGTAGGGEGKKEFCFLRTQRFRTSSLCESGLKA